MEFAARAEPARVVAAGVDLTRAVPAHPAAAGAAQAQAAAVRPAAGAEAPVVAVASAAGPQAEAAAAAAEAEEGNSLTCNTIKILDTTLYIIAWCFFFKDGTVFDLVLMTLNKQNLSLSNH